MLFPTTHWTLLAKARQDGNPAGQHALEELCRRYHGPVKAFIRSRGRSEQEAEDLAQDFLIHLLDNALFQRADRLRGRFRSLLLQTLVRFLHGEWDRRQAEKRGGGVAPSPLGDDEDPALALAGDEVAEFDRTWAVAMLKNAWTALEQEYLAAGRAETLSVLRRFLPGAASPPSYQEAAALLGISTGTLGSELSRMRARLREHTRAEIARTVSAPHEIQDELAYLQRLLEDRSTDLNSFSARTAG
jgi:RNA polymerase sigma-70 factor (ECF subfamily)